MSFKLKALITTSSERIPEDNRYVGNKGNRFVPYDNQYT